MRVLQFESAVHYTSIVIIPIILIYYILQTTRESTGSFSTRTNPLCESFGHCAQYFSVLSYYMALHAYRRFIFTNKLSSRRVYFSSYFSTENRWLFLANKKIKYHIIYSVHVIVVRVSLPLVVCDRWPCDLHALETDRYTRATRIIIIMCTITQSTAAISHTQ